MSDLTLPSTGAVCNRCGDPIRWARLPGGNWAPVDPDPHPAGHILMLDEQRGWPMSDEHRMEVMADENHEGRPRVFTDHRQTCGRMVNPSAPLMARGRRWAERETKRAVKLHLDQKREGRPVSRAVRRRIRAKVRALVMERDGHACVLCGATEDLTLDHIFPVIEGGSDDAINLRILCRSCNSSKGASIPESIRLLGREPKESHGAATTV